MRIGWLGSAVVALTIAGMNQQAYATTWSVTCTGNTTNLTQLSGGAGSSTLASSTFPGDESTSDGGGLGGTTGTAPDALGALIGTPDQGSDSTAALNAGGTPITGSFTTSLNSGDVVEINNFCDQVIEIRTNNITLVGPSPPVTFPSTPPSEFALTNGVSNQVIVNGAHGVIINDILIGASVSTVSLATTGFDFAGFGLLTVVNGSEVEFEDAQILNSSARGIYVDGNSILRAISSYVFNNGIGNTDQTDNMGIFATGASSVYLGKESGVDPTTVSSNLGDGVRVANGSSLIVNAGTIISNSHKQIFALTSSGVILNGNNAFAANGDAALVFVSEASNSNTDITVAIEGSSSLLVENQAYIDAGNSGTSIAAYGSGTVLLEGSFVDGGATTIEVTGGGLLALAGGNYICNGVLQSGTLTPTCTASGGSTNVAIQIDHVGALFDVGAVSGFNFTAQADTITGPGVLELQSTADLGAGLIGGTSPSLLWTTGSNGISVAQNSSIRLQGGVDITGSIALAQGSNGFVNLTTTNGHTLTNTVSAGISCPFVTVPASHLQLKANSLNTSSPATVLATSFTGATSPQCLPF